MNQSRLQRISCYLKQLSSCEDTFKYHLLRMASRADNHMWGNGHRQSQPIFRRPSREAAIEISTHFQGIFSKSLHVKGWSNVLEDSLLEAYRLSLHTNLYPRPMMAAAVATFNSTTERLCVKSREREQVMGRAFARFRAFRVCYEFNITPPPRPLNGSEH